MSEFTQILNAAAKGDSNATDRLFEVVYDELRKLAASKMSKESQDTLAPTALVHEVYLRLIQGSGGEENGWDGRGHFFAAASEAMRRILVDRARQRLSAKRGGGIQREPMEELSVVDRPEELLHVHEALDLLSQVDSQSAELVKLRYFAGLSIAESASLLGVSERTAHRDWAFARAWLARKIGHEGGESPEE